jgi:hypothetical protein
MSFAEDAKEPEVWCLRLCFFGVWKLASAFVLKSFYQLEPFLFEGASWHFFAGAVVPVGGV